MSLKGLFKEKAISLVQVKSKEQLEWLRVNRNRPEIAKFTLHAPHSQQQHNNWWLNQSSLCIAYYLIRNHEDKTVGAVWYDPLFKRCARGDVKIFILPEFARNKYGSKAFSAMLHLGFTNWNLGTITLEYPLSLAKSVAPFFHKFGFDEFPKEHQSGQYVAGQYIPTIKLFLTKEKWEKSSNGKNHPNGLEIRKSGTDTVISQL